MISVIGTVITYISLIPAVIRAIWIVAVSKVPYGETVKLRVYDTENDMRKTGENTSFYVHEIGSQEYAQYNLFRPNNAIIKKMCLQEIQYKYNGEEKRRHKTIEIFHGVSPQRPVCIKTERPEIFPQYMLTWKTTYGTKARYYFSYNGCTGQYDCNSISSKMGLWAKTRKVMGLE